MAEHEILTRKVRRALTEQGFTVTLAKRSHWHVRDTGRRLVTVVAASPSCRRSRLNARAELRRAGFVWPD